MISVQFECMRCRLQRISFRSPNHTPSTQADVADAVRAAFEASQPIYPLGGRTALDYGIAPTRPGIGLDLTGLNRVVDYTPRDMTILVEAGIRMADLAALAGRRGSAAADRRAARRRGHARRRRGHELDRPAPLRLRHDSRLRDRHSRRRRPRRRRSKAAAAS